MKNRRTSKPKDLRGEASANEMTGSLQRIVPSEEEIKKFNEEYNRKK